MKEPKHKRVESEIDEQQLVDHLRANPDFFSRHLELLGDIVIPHTTDGAVSLIERQVDVLRQRHENLQNHLQELLQAARDNERLAERLHRVAVEAAAMDEIDAALTSLPEIVRESFGVDYVSLRVEAADSRLQPRQEIVDPRDKTYRDVRIRIAHGRAVCDDRLAPTVLQYLFGDAAVDAVKSVALVPLGRHPVGVMALGDEDPLRFIPDMGTWYLDRIGDVLGAVMRRLI
jgi:uncharacterized protein YigA (DUF484 family)